ncbi:hypothetical protein BABINDRAFT_159335 [Babjeviella inositovora NRRL Y-12698]|uniref:tRNA pseudouridine synthase 1 n=1 Tax=Babjeviella inositovora NRRL Y-12698 TaxID=984486 RepID=A0A1E3QYX3_9ASCO|nr:uncharacterized protein BABINDRAFT_159335 [Babjeviella inositovora NRRL Y-12698]ODQ82836.1 hypothetical protein BABINDRAFT_159335 [Babjeviella inositovora NRRL Y-12698]
MLQRLKPPMLRLIKWLRPTRERVSASTVATERSGTSLRKRSAKPCRVYTPRMDADGNPIARTEERKPKKKVACLIGYCGTGYQGMQLNPGCKTIEGELFGAFVKAGAISQDNADDLKKSGFMRAARTDKGVHAAGNVISLKMIIEDPELLSKVNEELPEQIKVWGIERTNKSFDCRKMCSSRVYEYLIPSYAFLPPKPTSRLGQLIEEGKMEFPGSTREDPVGYQWWSDLSDAVAAAGVTAADLAAIQEHAGENPMGENGLTEVGALAKKVRGIENGARRAFRIDADKLNLFRTALQNFVGPHNFHNYTLGKHFKDPSANRYMKSLSVSEPFVIDGTEWLSVKIHGQSFMLHQIRKMISMSSMVVRTGCPLDRITEAFEQAKINIPKAPALGLLLEQPVYEAYNAKLETFGYEPITFERHAKEMDAFKMKYIYDKIYNEEVKENVFWAFYNFIDHYVSEDDTFAFFTAKGINKDQKVNVKEIVIPNESNANIEE